VCPIVGDACQCGVDTRPRRVDAGPHGSVPWQCCRGAFRKIVDTCPHRIVWQRRVADQARSEGKHHQAPRFFPSLLPRTPTSLLFSFPHNFAPSVKGAKHARRESREPFDTPFTEGRLEWGKEVRGGVREPEGEKRGEEPWGRMVPLPATLPRIRIPVFVEDDYTLPL